MNDNYSKLFKLLTSETPPLALRERIMERIVRIEKRTLYLRRVIFGGAITVSLAGLYPSVSYAVSELTQSSFANYLSLLSSDSDVALANLNAFFYSLAESFPIVGATLVLACFLIFFAALDRLFGKSAPRVHYSSHRYV